MARKKSESTTEESTSSKETVQAAPIGRMYNVRLTLIEPMLGTAPKSKKIYSDFIASKAPETVDTEDEVQSVQEMENSGYTGFHLDENGNPIIYDYVIKGYFKDVCSMLRRVPGTSSQKLTAFKKIIDGLIFAFPRQIPIKMSGPMDVLERPLRAQTAQGERVALAKSDMVPGGSVLEFKVFIQGGLGKVNEELAILREWFEYGRFRGLGQWRNGGYGNFNYELTIDETYGVEEPVQREAA